MARRRPSFVAIGLSIAAVTAVVLAVTAIGSPAQPATSSERLVTASKGVVQKTVSGSGSLEPSKQVDLSFGASGEVTRIYVSPGDKVPKGKLLARIDPSSANADLAQAKADLQTAEDNLTTAESSGSSTTTASTTAVYSFVSMSDESTTTTPTTTSPAPTTTTPAPTTTTPAPTTTTPAPTNTKSKQAQPKKPTTTPAATTQGTGSGGGAGGSSQGSTMSVAAAQAALTSAKLAVTKAEKEVAATKITAPYSGTVAAINGSVGDTANAGSSGSSSSSSSSSSGGSSGPSIAGGLGGGGSSSGTGSSSSSSSGFITFVAVHRFKMDVSLSESDIGSVKKGQAATVTVNAASGEQFAAHVTDIGVLPSSSGSTSAVSYPVTLTLDQSSSALKAGMSATADIVTARASGITIPTQALSGSTVTVESGGKQTTRSVQVGLTGDSSVQIVGGLNAGDQVVVRSTVVTPTTSGQTAGTGVTGRPGGGFGGGGFGGGGFGGGRPPGLGGGGFRGAAPG
jgi:multidrug efflux pump subunit AcrA (membrane-fusion protein)